MALPLPPGTKVMRGPSWQWKEQDGGLGGIGEIVGPGDEAGWVRTKWIAMDVVNQYRWSVTAQDLVLAPGTQVKRGPHWRFDQQDGGVGKTGTVVGQSAAAGWINVRWATNGVVNDYKFSPTEQHVAVVGSISLLGVTTIEAPAGGLPTGVRVVRGTDWEWAAQDLGGPGVILGPGDKPGWYQVQWDGNGSRNQYRFNEEKRDLALEPGTKVKRGPNWKFGDQDKAGTGVTGKTDAQGWVPVTWAGGGTNNYRFVPGEYHIECCPPEAPAVSQGVPGMPKGVLIVRGPSWSWGDQDGGPGKQGTVLGPSDSPGWCRVRWQSGVENQYKWTAAAQDIILAPGTRVRRGPQWRWQDQDGGAGHLGTVTGASDTNGWLRITWDVGGKNDYKMVAGDLQIEAVVEGQSGGGMMKGTRIVRGPEWKWEDQDGNAAGTVVGPGETPGWITVKWDVSGATNSYRDLPEARDLMLASGQRVCRGIHWQSSYGDVDGGPGGLGTVTKPTNGNGADGLVTVVWDKGGATGDYMFTPLQRAIAVVVGTSDLIGLPVGTRVTRGPQFQGTDKDDGGSGKSGLVGPPSKKGTDFVTVKWETTGLTQDLEFSAKCASIALAMGTRVRRGVHWRFEDQDGFEGALGTIVSAPDPDMWYYVQWDTGRKANYQFTPFMRHLAVVVGQATAGGLEAGTRVQRGTNWEWGEQDGGAGKLGTVLRAAEAKEGWFVVLWDATKEENSYRFSPVKTDLSLAIGTRCKRGPHWCWKEQDGGDGGEGTIIASADADQWYRVKWDRTGSSNIYEFSAYTRHIQITYSEPPTPKTLEQEKRKSVTRHADDTDTVNVRRGSFRRASVALAEVERDVFLSHAHGDDSSVHHEVVNIAKELADEHKLTTWLDEQDLTGNMATQLAKGIESSKVVLVFITEAYIKKVAGDRAMDPCKLEFTYASKLMDGASRMIPVVLEEKVRDQMLWVGPVGYVLGGSFYIDLTFPRGSEKRKEQLKKLAELVATMKKKYANPHHGS